MKIINWCSGGIGNRLKPLGSCALMALKTNRQLAIAWKPALRCLAPFDSLYENDIENVDLNALDPSTVSLYSDPSYVHHEVGLNGNTELLRLIEVVGCKHFTTFDDIVNDPAENIIVYNNDVCGSYGNIGEFLHSLRPIKSIQDKVDTFVRDNNITKNVVGVHARGTDFNLDVSYYITQMHKIDYNLRMFVCSDSQEFENRIKEVFGDRIIVRQDKHYVSKGSNSGGWTNNVNTPTESVQDSLVDLLLLAKTNLHIHHPNSTFAHIAKLY